MFTCLQDTRAHVCFGAGLGIATSSVSLNTVRINVAKTSSELIIELNGSITIDSSMMLDPKQKSLTVRQP